jgi:hypothetical protein
MKILSLRSIDASGVDQLCKRMNTDMDTFWTPSDEPINTELCRRIACIVVFLRSKLNVDASLPEEIAKYAQANNPTELRYAGKKYLKMARKLGDLGSVFWLPQSIPTST